MAIEMYNKLMESYMNMFSGFLHIHGIIRVFLFTVFVLFTAIVLEVIIIPIFLWIFGPIAAKGWNFAVTETIYEYVYIKFLSDPSKVPSEKISALYNKQQRKSEKNAEYINNISDINESGKKRGRRRIVNRRITAKTGQVLEKVLIILIIIFIASTAAHDIAYTKGIGRQLSSSKATTHDDPLNESIEVTPEPVEQDAPAETAPEPSPPKYLTLSEGTQAANIRTEPSFETSTVIVQVTKKELLEYMGESVPFEDGSSDSWHKVKTESGVEGWISGRIVIFED